MKLSLDEYDKVKAIVPGLFQFNENEMFTQAALAITDNELYLYDVDGEQLCSECLKEHFDKIKKVSLQRYLKLMTGW